MSEGIQAIIRQIETERDEYVRRCNAAISALKGETNEDSTSDEHRFSPRVAGRPADEIAGAGREEPSRVTPGAVAEKPRREPAAGADRGAGTKGAKSVKAMMREAVLSQTQPFTLRDVRGYIQTRYPDMAGKISSDRYSKELYQLRVAERLFEIYSKGEKGGANVYKVKAA